jgi:AraC-like DNA-binding protein
LTRLIDHDAEILVPELFLWRLADNIARKEGIEAIGIEAAKHMPIWESEPELTGLLGSLPTLCIALSRLCQLSTGFSNSVWFEISREENQALLKCSRRPRSAGEDQSELYCLQLMIQFVQLAAGPEWTPPEVFVSRANTLRLRKTAGFERTRVGFSDTFCSIVFPSEMLAWPMQDIGLPNKLQRLNPIANTFVGSLNEIIAVQLKYRSVDIQRVADMAGLSKRTLQRRLADVHLDYSTLIDHIWLQLALRLLQRIDVPLNEVAYELGYSDVAHFTRAFRRWTALTPGEYRRASQIVQ